MFPPSTDEWMNSEDLENRVIKLWRIIVLPPLNCYLVWYMWINSCSALISMLWEAFGSNFHHAAAITWLLTITNFSVVLARPITLNRQQIHVWCQSFPPNSLTHSSVSKFRQNYNLFARRRASKDYKRSLQRQDSDEVLKNMQVKSENWLKSLSTPSRPPPPP